MTLARDYTLVVPVSLPGKSTTTTRRQKKQNDRSNNGDNGIVKGRHKTGKQKGATDPGQSRTNKY